MQSMQTPASLTSSQEAEGRAGTPCTPLLVWHTRLVRPTPGAKAALWGRRPVRTPVKVQLRIMPTRPSTPLGSICSARGGGRVDVGGGAAAPPLPPPPPWPPCPAVRGRALAHKHRGKTHALAKHASKGVRAAHPLSHVRTYQCQWGRA